MDIGPH